MHRPRGARGGIAATSARRPPRNATPKPMPPRIEPARYSGARVGRGRGDDQQHAGRERDRAGAGADPRRRAAEAAAARPPPSRPARRRRCRRRSTLVVSKSVRRELRAEREEEAADRPRREHARARRAGTARRTAAGTLGRCGVSRKRRPVADRLGHQSAPAKAIANSTNSTTYGRTRGAVAELDERRRDEHAEADAARAGDAVGEADAGRVAARVQVEQRRAGGAQRGARSRGPGAPRATKSQAAESASMNSDGRRHQRAERDEQHRPAPDVVGDAPGEQQRGEHAERVGRVDQRQGERREVPELAVGAVERRRRDRREQRRGRRSRLRRSVAGTVRQRADETGVLSLGQFA